MDTKPISLDTPNASVTSFDPFEAFRAIEGCPYAEYNCWDVASYLLSERYQSDIVMLLSNKTPSLTITEIWFKNQAERPEALIQPWDICFFAINRQALDHMGIILSREYFATAREQAGVIKERFELWTPHLLQVARITPRAKHAI